MYYTYLNQQLIPGNKYLFHTNLVHKGKKNLPEHSLM